MARSDAVESQTTGERLESGAVEAMAEARRITGRLAAAAVRGRQQGETTGRRVLPVLGRIVAGLVIAAVQMVSGLVALLYMGLIVLAASVLLSVLWCAAWSVIFFYWPVWLFFLLPILICYVCRRAAPRDRRRG